MTNPHYEILSPTADFISIIMIICPIKKNDCVSPSQNFWDPLTPPDFWTPCMNFFLHYFQTSKSSSNPIFFKLKENKIPLSFVRNKFKRHKSLQFKSCLFQSVEDNTRHKTNYLPALYELP